MKKTLITLSLFVIFFMIFGTAKLYQYNEGIKDAEINFVSLSKKHLASTAQELSTLIISNEDFDLLKPQINALLIKSKLNSNGFSFILNKKGDFVCYPGDSLSDETVNIYSYAKDEKVASLSVLGDQAKIFKAGVFDLFADDSGERMWGFTAPILGTELSVASVMLKEPILKANENQQHTLFYGVVGLICGVSLLLFTICFAFFKSPQKKVWYSTSLLSISLLIGTCALCIFSHNNLDYSYVNEVPITEPAILESYLNELEHKTQNLGFGSPIKIPTGIYINTVEIESAVNIRITGLVWQRFDKESESVTPGVYFPDAVEPEIEEMYSNTTNDIKTIGWKFNILMRESFSGLRYPFDVEAIWIRMLPNEFYKNIIFVPDFDDYELINPVFLPGVDPELVLPGWKMKKSFFSYLAGNYNTNFGIKNYVGTRSYPELYFNITIQRNFLDPFISVILPLLVVAILVFILLLTCSCKDSELEKLGFSAGAILSGIAALFFVVIIAQIDLRKNLAAEQIIYMDFYYFIIYTVFLIVSVNSLMICWPEKFDLLCYKNNLLVKSAYWPFITITLFVASIYYFHP
ncbi:MAG: hypothetical protein PHF29_04225 [Candidatus Riflebacteria bacterium]|nr:hypothetical protein [Candidatus Riflebacteria bacterium]